METSDDFLKKARELAESKFPDTILDKNIKDFWITGFIHGYLSIVTETLSK